MRIVLAITLSLLFATSALANRKLLLFTTVVGGGGGGSSGFILQTDGVSYILLVDGVSRLRRVN